MVFQGGNKQPWTPETTIKRSLPKPSVSRLSCDDISFFYAFVAEPTVVVVVVGSYGAEYGISHVIVRSKLRRISRRVLIC